MSAVCVTGQNRRSQRRHVVMKSVSHVDQSETESSRLQLLRRRDAAEPAADYDHMDALYWRHLTPHLCVDTHTHTHFILFFNFDFFPQTVNSAPVDADETQTPPDTSRVILLADKDVLDLITFKVMNLI